MPVIPARPKGPHLNCLRAFEAAARLGGFALAAEELGVTPGAISQHIRALEDWAGLKLFERRSHGVRLTADGRAILPTFTIAFDALGDAIRAVRDVSPVRTVTIAALPSVAQLWLQPRLSRLRAALPDVNLSFVVMETPPNLSRDLCDVSLYIRPPHDCPNGVILARDTLVPMCAAALAATLTQPSDLANANLLHDEAWSDDWPSWATANGVTLPNVQRGPRFSLYAMAVEEAKVGAGVIMGHSALLASALDAGTLVAPLAAAVPSAKALVADFAEGPLENTLRALLGQMSEQS